jgi:3-dehydroquinate synthetase/shikimate kinase
MDDELTSLFQKSIAEVFRERGENYFRQTEATLLNNLNDQERPKVVATGGGIVLNHNNRVLLKNALTFFLDLPPEQAWERVKKQTDPVRPLAAAYAGFRDLHDTRLDLYRQCGAVFSAQPSPETITQRILDFILWEEPITLKSEGRQSLIRADVSPARLSQLREEVIGARKILVLQDHFFRASGDDQFSRTFGDCPIHYPEKRGEEAKTLAEAGKILLRMTEAGLDRSDFLVVRGGGGLTDLGALCAGLYKRGLNLILVPTTLLAAVDAAIGGKAAVNLAGAKNQIGLFYLANEVWIDPLVFRTLSEPLRREGLTEAYKTALLFDPGLTHLITRDLEALIEGDAVLLSAVVHASASHKANLAAQDLREERGIRDILNLGHTYGHAVESFNGPRVSHGRAVALGLAVALAYSQKKYNLDKNLVTSGLRICRTLAGGAFPPAPPSEEALRLLSFDKKIRAGSLKFVALRAPGQSVLDSQADPAEILEAAVEVLDWETRTEAAIQ